MLDQLHDRLLLRGYTLFHARDVPGCLCSKRHYIHPQMGHAHVYTLRQIITLHTNTAHYEIPFADYLAQTAPQG
jgi:hypothetical protein